MAEIDSLEIRINTNAKEAAADIANLRSSVDDLSSNGGISDVAKRAAVATDRARTKMSDFIAALAGATSKAEILRIKMDMLAWRTNKETDPKKKFRLAERLANTEQQYNKLINSAKKAASAQEEAAEKAESSAKKFSLAETAIGKIAKQFWRLLKYRVLRSIISGIANALKEGVTNIYEYSSAVGTTFANSLDTCKSGLTSVKNSLGSVAAQVIQVFTPYIERACQAIIKFNNQLAALFAALRGESTFTAAVWYADSVDSAASSAAGSVSKLNRMLLGIDELNVFSDTSSSGGGGSSSGTNYEDMFTEAAVDSYLPTWAQGFIDNLETIKTLAVAIGGAFLAWELTDTFLNVFGLGEAVGDSTLIASLSSVLQYASAGIAGAFIGGLTGKALDNYVIGPAIEAFGGDQTTADAYKNFSWFGEDGAFSTISTAFEDMYGECDTFTEKLNVWAAEWARIFNGAWSKISKTASNSWSNITGDLSDDWDSFVEWFEETKLAIKNSPTVTKITSVIETLRSKWYSFKLWLANLQLNLPSIKVPKFTWGWKTLDENSTIAKILTKLGFEAKTPYLDISWNAKGGIVDGATLIGAGERGAEAILPLETNTGWMDTLARKVAISLMGAGGDETISLVLNLDGDAIYRNTIKRNRANTARTGKNALFA